MRCEIIHLKDKYPFLAEEGRDPTLTVYIQNSYADLNQTPKRRPGIVICPGGGYANVSPREAEPVAMKLLPEGYNVFILNYSVKPNGYPVQLVEVAAAMELIHENSQLWDTDADRIAIMGFSAGGHLAAHYSNAYDCDGVRKVFPQSKPVQATILGYPVITADDAYAHKGSFRVLAGHDYPMSREEIDRLSCEKLVTEKTPPAFVWHTAADKTVPVEDSLLYAMALSKHKIPFALHIYPYGPHGLSTADRQTNETIAPESTLAATWLPEMNRWLKIIFA